MSPSAREHPIPPVGGYGSSESRGNWCSKGRAVRCVPSTDTHTFACQNREGLGRQILQYLRDPKEAQERSRVTGILHGPLLPLDVFTLFLNWLRIRAEMQLGVTEPVANIVLHRTAPGIGEFMAMLTAAEEILAEEILNEQGQRRFENPGVDHENHIL